MSIELKAIDFDDVFEYLKWLMLAAILFALIAVGYKLGKNQNAEVIAKQRTAIAQQRMAIDAYAAALRQVNAEAAKAIAAEKKAKAAAADAGKIADQAEQRAERQQNEFQRKLAAARKKPDCAVLLSTDVRKVCGL